MFIGLEIRDLCRTLEIYSNPGKPFLHGLRFVHRDPAILEQGVPHIIHVSYSEEVKERRLKKEPLKSRSLMS